MLVDVNPDAVFHMGGIALTIQILELMVRTLEREGEILVLGCAKAPCGGHSSTLMEFGAYLAEQARTNTSKGDC